MNICAILLAVVASLGIGLAEDCHVAPIFRKDCGWIGITPEKCESQGCCYDSSITGGAKWCFKKAKSDHECEVLPKYRKECGYFNITKDICEGRECCFNSNARGENVKWCFQKSDGEEVLNECHVAPIYREECGWIGISETECVNKSCCYDSTIQDPDVKWCFKTAIRECEVLPNYRTECGWEGITKEACETEGCCWNSNTSGGAKWCFKKKSA
ncbi:integumentary mucin C.1-like isoform X1 [Mytilus trossulus]|uniref:integumentary mucin C.1-like isoform X1 n=1 Tax=Mytilus trossulus TaxID=6551 RepID=UPI003004D9BD